LLQKKKVIKRVVDYASEKELIKQYGSQGIDASKMKKPPIIGMKKTLKT
jgi:hypothetical protein